MEITNCTRADFYQIQREISDFWGNDRTLHLHHPIFIYEFGNSAFVIKEGEQVAAYLFGLLSQTEPLGYVHLIGVRATYQRRGFGKQLYQHFTQFARAHHCQAIKAITTASNLTSIAFHKSIGMSLIGDADQDGIPVVKDYSGPGQDRVVFQMEIR